MRLASLRVMTLAMAIVCIASTPAVAYTSIVDNAGAANIGIAVDSLGNYVYFVEWTTGKLKRVTLTPGCAAPACTVDEIATGFSHPEDVAIDLVHNTAYVTTRDDAGTTGALWRVDLTTNAKTLVTFNLDAPHQIVLDVAADTAYVVGYGAAAGSGRLWRIELSTGSKTSLVSGLGHPVGLAITADRTRAYVTEQDSGSLTAIDLATRTRIAPAMATGLTQPFFLGWADPGENALYVIERGAANDVVRVDLPTMTNIPMSLGAIPGGLSGIAVDFYRDVAYVTTNDSVGRLDLGSLPTAPGAFLGVGHVPASMIDPVDGYATTDPGYWIHFKDCPFGGTLNIFGNFTDFVARSAAYYRVKVTYGGSTTAVTTSWTAARFNPTSGKFENATVAPVPGHDYYAVEPEYATAHPERWYPSFLMVRWPTGANGLYTFTVELLDSAGNAATVPQPTDNHLAIRVDNTPLDVDLLAIYQSGVTAAIDVCAIVNSGTPEYQIEVKAYDPNGHLLNYYGDVYFGHNGYSPIGTADNYEPGHVDADGPRQWHGVTKTRLPAGAFWPAQCDCAHTFFVHAWKRTIDGYNYIIKGWGSQSITIMNKGVSCPK